MEHPGARVKQVEAKKINKGKGIRVGVILGRIGFQDSRKYMTCNWGYPS